MACNKRLRGQVRAFVSGTFTDISRVCTDDGHSASARSGFVVLRPVLRPSLEFPSQPALQLRDVELSLLYGMPACGKLFHVTRLDLQHFVLVLLQPTFPHCEVKLPAQKRRFVVGNALFSAGQTSCAFAET
mmetsp:Transcript_18727/g.35139  ORF Transcript_18727/g.35139 Transcript_18727/m.35139 type:complete len:131 (+) Transcript_18727:889-1281(+)